MATLTEVSIISRKIIRYSIYSIIIIIIGRILFLTGLKIYRYFFPPAPPPPTVSFGKLPPLVFPEGKKIESANYILELPEGSLPVFPTQAKVYFQPRLLPNLLSLETITEKLQKMGYRNPEKVSDTIYRFTHRSVPAKLEINIINANFSLSYDLVSDRSPLDQIPAPPEVAVSIAKRFLDSGELLTPDIKNGPYTFSYHKIQEKELLPALGRVEANLTKINLFRKSYDDLPSLTPNPEEANIWFMISGSGESAKQIIFGKFNYFSIDESQHATYPLKTSEQAFEDLKMGKAYIAKAPNTENIIIRKVYLAYYDSPIYSEFFQPIVVFEGDNFLAYVPAVSPEYYGE